MKCGTAQLFILHLSSRLSSYPAPTQLLPCSHPAHSLHPPGNHLWYIPKYRQTGWIGTVEVNRDMGLEPGEIQKHNVSPGSSPASQFTSTVLIHPV